MNPILSLHTWVSLPNEVRYRIRALFDIPRSSNTVVSDGMIETDGTTAEDFKSLTISKMQTYLETTEDNFHKLFDLVVARVIDELENPVIITTPGLEVLTVTSTTTLPKKRGPKAKK